MEMGKEVTVGQPVVVAGVTLVPVIRTVWDCWRTDGGVSFLVARQPVGVVAICPAATKAFRVTGEEVPLKEFIQEYPDLAKILGPRVDLNTLHFEEEAAHRMRSNREAA